MNQPEYNIPPQRTYLYYAGMVVTGAGILLFLSVFLTFMSRFGDFTDFEGRSRSEGFRAISGIVLIAAGQFIMAVGRRGAAGAGLILNPQQARRDLEPWNRATGGMVNDALSEVDAMQNLTAPQPEKLLVKVRCPSCSALNEEQARFCSQCGVSMS